MATRFDTAYDREILAVRRRVMAYTAAQWQALSSYRDADAERLIARIAPRVAAGQKKIAELTDAYITRVATSELGMKVKRGRVATVSVAELRDVSSEELYRRPFVTVYTDLSRGTSLTAAVSAGAARLADIASTNLQLAKTHAARAALDRTPALSYERTLTGRENCALCVIASTQRYNTGDLLPIHPGCDCGVKPRRDQSNERVLNEDLLEQLHTAVEAEFGGTDRAARFIDGPKSTSDYLDLMTTQEHGEIGPVLTWRHQHFTSLADITAAQ